MQVRISNNQGFSSNKIYNVYIFVDFLEKCCKYLILVNNCGQIAFEKVDNNVEFLNTSMSTSWVSKSGSWSNGHVSIENALVHGYKEAIELESHLCNLIDSPTIEDLKIFEIRKKEIDLWNLQERLTYIVHTMSKLSNIKNENAFEEILFFIKQKEFDLVEYKIKNAAGSISPENRRLILGELSELEFTRK